MRAIPLVIILLSFFPWLTLGQSPGQETDYPDTTTSAGDTGITPEIQNLFEDLFDEANGNVETERLLQIHEKPFDLNRVSTVVLETIPGISAAEANEIVRTRLIVKKFASIGQLAALPGGSDILRKLGPFVYVPQAPSAGGEHVPSSIRFTTREVLPLQKRKGFLDGSFSGSRIKSYNRISINGWHDVDFGLLFEKDEGERYADGSVSGFVSFEKLVPQSRIVIGDYVVETGQGLVLWRQSSLGKSTSAITGVKKSALGVRPYCSSGESNFFRGLAVAANFGFGEGDLGCTAFISSRSFGGSLDSSGNLVALYKDGLYRTDLELAKRNAVGERAAGGAIQFTSEQGWELGASLLNSMIDKSVQRASPRDFAGNLNSVVGLNAGLSSGRVNFFVETAFVRNGTGAGVVGAVFNFGLQSAATMIYRHYPADFQNSRAHGFGERGETNNEMGMFIGVQLPVSGILRVSGYVDQFKFPWPTFSNAFPTAGREIRIEVDGEFPQGLRLTFAYRNERKEVTGEVADDLIRDRRVITERLQQSIRFTARKNLSSRITLTGRIEVTEVQSPKIETDDCGMLVYQSMHYSTGRFAVEARLAYFDTHSYESRLYEYENDLAGVFSNPALSGRGQRWYFILRYSPSNTLRLTAKYAETRMEGVRNIGTGPMQIAGDVDNRIAVQMDIKL